MVLTGVMSSWQTSEQTIEGKRSSQAAKYKNKTEPHPGTAIVQFRGTATVPSDVPFHTALRSETTV